MRAAAATLVVLLALPLAHAEWYADPTGDEVIGFPPGPAIGKALGCRSPSADIVDVSVEHEGDDIGTRVSFADHDAPMSCGPIEGAWLTSSAYLDVYTEDLASSMNVVVYSADRYVGDPQGIWAVSVALYVGESGGTSYQDFVPASELWSGDTFEVRVPAQGEWQGVPWDASGLEMSGYVESTSWTNWPTMHAYGGLPQRSHDRAEIPRITL